MSTICRSPSSAPASNRRGLSKHPRFEHTVVDVRELRIPIRMLTTLLRLHIALPAEQHPYLSVDAARWLVDSHRGTAGESGWFGRAARRVLLRGAADRGV